MDKSNQYPVKKFMGPTKSQLFQMVDLANMIPKLYSNDKVLLIVKFDPKCKRKQTNQTNKQY